MKDEFDKLVYQVNDLLCDSKKWRCIAKETDSEGLKHFAEKTSSAMYDSYKEAHEMLMKKYAE